MKPRSLGSKQRLAVDVNVSVELDCDRIAGLKTCRAETIHQLEALGGCRFALGVDKSRLTLVGVDYPNVMTAAAGRFADRSIVHGGRDYTSVRRQQRRFTYLRDKREEIFSIAENGILETGNNRCPVWRDMHRG